MKISKSLRNLKYAGDVRDEDVMRLWGKILAGEVRNPGLFSLKTLDILHGIDQKDAECFTSLAPYVMNERYLPLNAAREVGLNDFDLANLASTGLVITTLFKTYEDQIAAGNRVFVVYESTNAANRLQPCHMEAIFLTEAASELYRIIPVSEDESRHGAEFFKKCIYENMGIELEIGRV